jgi:hypothetical protein
MAQQAPPNNVVLHCEVEVGGKTLWADTLISRRAWDAADETMREAFRDRAREALAGAIVRQCDPPVTVTAPTAEES